MQGYKSWIQQPGLFILKKMPGPYTLTQMSMIWPPSPQPGPEQRAPLQTVAAGIAERAREEKLGS